MPEEAFFPHGGVDESGKGDFFGPLVIAGVFVDEETEPILRKPRLSWQAITVARLGEALVQEPPESGMDHYHTMLPSCILNFTIAQRIAGLGNVLNITADGAVNVVAKWNERVGG